MVKKNVLVIALICIVAAIVGLMFIACASAPASPDKEKATELYKEVTGLRDQFVKKIQTEGIKGNKNPNEVFTQEPYGRAESIYALSKIYIEKKMYTEALPGLGQAKKYYEGFLK